MPWNWLVGAGNTGYVVRGDHSDENNIKRWEDTSHMQRKKESSGCKEEAAPGSIFLKLISDCVTFLCTNLPWLPITIGKGPNFSISSTQSFKIQPSKCFHCSLHTPVGVNYSHLYHFPLCTSNSFCCISSVWEFLPFLHSSVQKLLSHCPCSLHIPKSTFFWTPWPPWLFQHSPYHTKL